MMRIAPRFVVAAGIGLAFLPSVSGTGERKPVVRLAVVNTPEDVLQTVIPDFEKETGYRVTIHSGNDCFEQARNGRADLVISHYGHPGVEIFVTKRHGLWPRTVFSNQAVLVGPSSDPARVRGVADAALAFKRIAETGSPFVANRLSGMDYLEKILWEIAGRPPRGAWYIDQKQIKEDAMETAARRGAYTLWGLIPFLRLKKQTSLALEPLVVADPLLQRMMVSVVVNPETVAGVNLEGAQTLQHYLISPRTQARVLAFRYPGLAIPAWWPAGRHNSTEARQ